MRYRTVPRVAAVAVLLLGAMGGQTARSEDPARTCFGHRATLVGTNGDDVLRGTKGSDVTIGLGGNDVIKGMRGHDFVCGKDGADREGWPRRRPRLGERGYGPSARKCWQGCCLGRPNR